MGGPHDIRDGHRMSQEVRPGRLHRWAKGALQHQRERVTVASQELGHQRIVALEYLLIQNDQAYRATLTFVLRVRESLFQVPGAKGVVSVVPQRRAQESSRPLRGLNDEHSGRNHFTASRQSHSILSDSKRGTLPRVAHLRLVGPVELHSPVLGPARGRLVGCYRHVGPESLRRQLPWRYPVGLQERLHRPSPRE
jgi:hypothetical protein